MARIYSITVSNAVDGVSSSCRACALSTQPSSSTCVPCPAGHYIDSVTSQCTECPRDTRIVSHATPGPDACKPCGPASKSDKVCKSCKLFVFAILDSSTDYNHTPASLCLFDRTTVCVTVTATSPTQRATSLSPSTSVPLGLWEL